MRMTLPAAIIMAAAIWGTQILMSGSPHPEKQERNRGQAHESLSFFVRGTGDGNRCSGAASDREAVSFASKPLRSIEALPEGKEEEFV